MNSAQCCIIIKQCVYIPFPKPWISVRKLSVPRCPSTNWPTPPTSRSFSSCPSYVWSDKSISSPRWTPFGILYETSPSIKKTTKYGQIQSVKLLLFSIFFNEKCQLTSICLKYDIASDCIFSEKIDSNFDYNFFSDSL